MLRVLKNTGYNFISSFSYFWHPLCTHDEIRQQRLGNERYSARKRLRV